MKLRFLNTTNCQYFPIKEFRRRQWRRGLPLSLIGCVVYGFLRLISKKPKSFHGICPYFEIGKDWGGFEMGWFFVCAKDSDELLRAHELGHGLVNANIGGFRVLGYSFASMVRYWWRVITKPKTDYYSWWYEKQATEVGQAYVIKVIDKMVQRWVLNLTRHSIFLELNVREFTYFMKVMNF